MRFAARSHVGLVRKVNQDGFLVKREDMGRYVAIVADGMGGHVAGEVASALAVSSVWDALSELTHMEDQPQRLERAIHMTNAKIYEQSSSNQTFAGMGTTIVAAIADTEHVSIAHVGDSRAYRFRKEEGLIQLTEDHSLVNELVRRGQILPEEAASHPQRSMLTRALGTLPDVPVDCRSWDWQSGDRILLCSDGLTNCVSTKRIIEFLLMTASLDAQVDALIQAALENGGHDNITVIALAHEGSEKWREGQ